MRYNVEEIMTRAGELRNAGYSKSKALKMAWDEEKRVSQPFDLFEWSKRQAIRLANQEWAERRMHIQPSVYA